MCLTGKKVLCRLDPNAASRSGIFSRFGIPDNSSDFSLKWFGNAPFCNGSPCTAINEGFIPVLADKYGDGKKCLTGEKFLGIRPNKISQIDSDFLEKSRLMCTELSVENEKTRNKIIEDIFAM